MHDETIAIHGGYTPDGTRAVAVPIYQTVAHDFIDAAHAGAVLDLETPGFHYNRLNNPTLDVLEQRICALEGGTAALVVASGMAAVSYAILTVASVGSNIVVAPQLYGATFTYFAHVLPTLGIEARFAVDDRAESIAPLIDDNTRAVFCETIGNPAGNIVDLEAVAAVAHAAGVPLIVDNTVATPLMLKPFEHGADVVVHSLTKFVGGHGTTLGGAIVDGGRFPWADHPDRFPMFNQPEPAFHGVVFARDFPERPFTVRARSTQLRNSGATLSPFNAFMLLQGLETMAVRLERHEANARAVADYLAADPRVAWVSFAGFPDHPYHHLVERYLHGRVPSIVTFGAEGGYDAGLAFFDALQLVKRLLNLGDAKTLAIHPASTTHRQLSDEELVKAGIRPETIRLSIGIEHIDDIIDDIDQALDKAMAGPLRSSLGVELLRLSSRQSFDGIDLEHNDVRLRPAVPAEYVDQVRPQTLEVGGTVGHHGHVDTTLRLADEEVDDAGGGNDSLLEVRAGHHSTAFVLEHSIDPTVDRCDAAMSATAWARLVGHRHRVDEVVADQRLHRVEQVGQQHPFGRLSVRDDVAVGIGRLENDQIIGHVHAFSDAAGERVGAL